MLDNLFFKNRVQENILKSFGYISEDSIEKARSGTYADTAENRKLGRVGRQYGSKKQEEKKGDNKSPKKDFVDHVLKTDDWGLADNFMSENQRHFSDVLKEAGFESYDEFSSAWGKKGGDEFDNLFRKMVNKIPSENFAKFGGGYPEKHKMSAMESAVKLETSRRRQDQEKKKKEEKKEEKFKTSTDRFWDSLPKKVQQELQEDYEFLTDEWAWRSTYRQDQRDAIVGWLDYRFGDYNLKPKK